jgi:putative ABC transport system permease protein
MLRAVLRDMRAHPGRVAMTLVAIVLGVGFVVATWVVSDSAAATVISGSTRGDLAARVAAQDDLTPADRDRLAALPGVDRATGVHIGYTAVVKADGKIGTSYYPDLGGTSWDSSERFALVSGRGPVGPEQIALEEETAVEAGLGTGDTARLLDKQGNSYRAKVSGVFTYRTGVPGEIIPAAAFDASTATQRLGADYSRIELFGADHTAIAASAQRLLGEGYDVATGAQLEAERQRINEQEVQVVRNFLLAFAGVALMAGMFVIANTFTMLVAQRTRHFALLRAVGAKRGQVRRAVLAEAVVLGLIGATLGAIIGVAIAWATMMVVPVAGETIIFKVSPAAIGIGYLTGVIVTVAAAYGSARRGAAIAPVAALGTDAALPKRSLVLRTVAGSVAMLAGVIAVVATSGPALTDPQRVVGMGGALLGWFAVILLAPLLASAILNPLSRLVSKRGVVSRLAVRNAIRDPRRTAATASALMIGLALVTAFATVGSSLTAGITEAIEAELPPETLVVQSVQTWSGMPGGIVEKVRAVPGVDAVAVPVERPGKLTFNGRPAGYAVTSLDPYAIGRAVTPQITSGSADLRSGVIVPQRLADSHGIRAGDRLTVGDLELNVAGVYGESQLFYGVLIDESLLPPPGEDSYLSGIYLSGSDPKAALERAFADRPDVIVLDRAALIAQQVEPLELALGIVYALLAAAVIIAVFGVVNTLALSVLERTREIGVFRAVGASRALVRRAVRWESVVIAAYGGLLGVGVGVLLGGVMQHMIMSRPITGMSVPLPLVAGALAAMVIVGVLAAVWPARRAARTDILNAIAHT